MAKALGIDYSEISNLVKQLQQIDGNIKKTTEQALKKSQKYSAGNLHSEMAKHKQSGETEASIVEDSKVQWIGSIAQIDIGFDISNGGLPSIFLMYGTPRMSKDQKLFNAIYGKKTSNEIANIQKEIFFNEIKKLGG